jgi:hypothetical protein
VLFVLVWWNRKSKSWLSVCLIRTGCVNVHDLGGGAEFLSVLDDDGRGVDGAVAVEIDRRRLIMVSAKPGWWVVT